MSPKNSSTESFSENSTIRNIWSFLDSFVVRIKENRIALLNNSTISTSDDVNAPPQLWFNRASSKMYTPGLYLASRTDSHFSGLFCISTKSNSKSYSNSWTDRINCNIPMSSFRFRRKGYVLAMRPRTNDKRRRELAICEPLIRSNSYFLRYFCGQLITVWNLRLKNCDQVSLLLRRTRGLVSSVLVVEF